MSSPTNYLSQASRISKKTINKALERFGYRCSRIEPVPPDKPYLRQKKLFTAYDINTVFDVGANVGQYGSFLRKVLNFEGRIISFEPMTREFNELKKISEKDPLWDVENCALGKNDEIGIILISGNSVSSSLLEMLPSVVDACGQKSAYIGKEDIHIKRLDSMIDKHCSGDERIFLKIDTQGSERSVLDGAAQSLRNISGLQIELSFIPFYKGDTIYTEMIRYVADLGFQMMSIEPLLEQWQTGQLLQADGIFFRNLEE